MKTVWDVESAVGVTEGYESAIVGAESAGQIPFGDGASGTTVKTNDLRVIFYE